MGYNTSHQLVVLEGDPNLIRKLREYSDEARYNLNDEGDTEESGKWYESAADMKKLSTEYPHALFQLDGQGDNSDDLWRQYWKNGKCQNIVAQIVYEPYDEAKLK